MSQEKRQLQTIGENLAQTSKQFFKSHDLSIWLQILLILVPMALSLISIYLWGESNSASYASLIKKLDFLSFFFSILSLSYYVFYWRNTELYKDWWERYLVLYKKVEHYYRSWWPYTNTEITVFVNEQNNLVSDNTKPIFHIFSKLWTDWVLEKEMKYANEKVVWWRAK